MLIKLHLLKSRLAARLPAFVRPQFLAEGERGMSLIEIIIVVALLGTLMAYMVSNLIGQSDNAKIDQTKLAQGVIAQSLQMYRIHNNKYPTTDQGLNALLTNPGDSKSWRGPYIEPNKLKDPWGNDFHYESDGKSVKISSSGLDGTFGNEDDINYPDESQGGKPAAGGGG